MDKKNDCGKCKYQMTGFDGGFFGLPLTCECRIYGETENRKNCSKFKKRLTKSDLIMRITELEEENEQLRKNFDDLVQYAGKIAKRNVQLDEEIAKLKKELQKQ